MKSVNPATGEVIWEGAAASSAQVHEAVETARGAFVSWARKSLQERLEIIERFREIVENRKEEFAEIISQETGKPRWDALTEVGAMIGKVAISVKAYEERTGQHSFSMAGGITARLSHKPHGVMAVFGP